MSAMPPFTVHCGVAAALLRINIDTDAIIPSREMKRVSKEGLGEALFANWRYADVATREEDPNFVLNQTPYQSATIIVAGDNFGCGSSREHAVWALSDFGIRVVIAPSFGSIFFGNCVRNGILPVRLSQQLVENLAAEIASNHGVEFRVDLAAQELTTPAGIIAGFEIAPGDKQMLLEGLDGIAVTEKRDREILDFVAADRLARPWIYL